MRHPLGAQAIGAFINARRTDVQPPLVVAPTAFWLDYTEYVSCPGEPRRAEA
jgi:hypothetical protein